MGVREKIVQGVRKFMVKGAGGTAGEAMAEGANNFLWHFGDRRAFFTDGINFPNSIPEYDEFNAGKVQGVYDALNAGVFSKWKAKGNESSFVVKNFKEFLGIAKSQCEKIAHAYSDYTKACEKIEEKRIEVDELKEQFDKYKDKFSAKSVSETNKIINQIHAFPRIALVLEEIIKRRDSEIKSLKESCKKLENEIRSNKYLKIIFDNDKTKDLLSLKDNDIGMAVKKYFFSVNDKSSEGYFDKIKKLEDSIMKQLSIDDSLKNEWKGLFPNRNKVNIDAILKKIEIINKGNDIKNFDKFRKKCQESFKKYKEATNKIAEAVATVSEKFKTANLNKKFDDFFAELKLQDTDKKTKKELEKLHKAYIKANKELEGKRQEFSKKGIAGVTFEDFSVVKQLNMKLVNYSKEQIQKIKGDLEEYKKIIKNKAVESAFDKQIKGDIDGLKKFYNEKKKNLKETLNSVASEASKAIEEANTKLAKFGKIIESLKIGKTDDENIAKLDKLLSDVKNKKLELPSKDIPSKESIHTILVTYPEKLSQYISIREKIWAKFEKVTTGSAQKVMNSLKAFFNDFGEHMHYKDEKTTVKSIKDKLYSTPPKVELLAKNTITLSEAMVMAYIYFYKIAHTGYDEVLNEYKGYLQEANNLGR